MFFGNAASSASSVPFFSLPPIIFQIISYSEKACPSDADKCGHLAYRLINRTWNAAILEYHYLHLCSHRCTGIAEDTISHFLARRRQLPWISCWKINENHEDKPATPASHRHHAGPSYDEDSIVPTLSLHIQTPLSAMNLSMLSALPQLSSLTELHITTNLFSSELQQQALSAFSSSSKLSNIKTLSFQNHRMSSAASTFPSVFTTSRPSFLLQLTSLSFKNFGIPNESLIYIANSPFLGNLTSLCLPMNRINHTGFASLASSLFLTNLQELDLMNSQEMNDTSMAVLASSPNMTSLTKLCVSHPQQIDIMTIQALASSPSFCNLQELRIPHSSISSPMIEPLTKSENLTNLTCLDLSWNALDADCISLLASSKTMSGLRSLNLSFNDFTIYDPEVSSQLLSGASLTKLKYLEIIKSQYWYSHTAASQKAISLRSFPKFSNTRIVHTLS